MKRIVLILLLCIAKKQGVSGIVCSKRNDEFICSSANAMNTLTITTAEGSETRTVIVEAKVPADLEKECMKVFHWNKEDGLKFSPYLNSKQASIFKYIGQTEAALRKNHLTYIHPLGVRYIPISLPSNSAAQSEDPHRTIDDINRIPFNLLTGKEGCSVGDCDVWKAQAADPNESYLYLHHKNYKNTITLANPLTLAFSDFNVMLSKKENSIKLDSYVYSTEEFSVTSIENPGNTEVSKLVLATEYFLSCTRFHPVLSIIEFGTMYAGTIPINGDSFVLRKYSGVGITVTAEFEEEVNIDRRNRAINVEYLPIDMPLFNARMVDIYKTPEQLLAQKWEREKREKEKALQLANGETPGSRSNGEQMERMLNGQYQLWKWNNGVEEQPENQFFPHDPNNPRTTATYLIKELYTRSAYYPIKLYWDTQCRYPRGNMEIECSKMHDIIQTMAPLLHGESQIKRNISNLSLMMMESNPSTSNLILPHLNESAEVLQKLQKDLITIYNDAIRVENTNVINDKRFIIHNEVCGIQRKTMNTQCRSLK